MIHRGTEIKILDFKAYMSGAVVGIRDGAIEMQFGINETDGWRSVMWFVLWYGSTILEFDCRGDIQLRESLRTSCLNAMIPVSFNPYIRRRTSR